MSNKETLEKAIQKAIDGYEGIYSITDGGDVVSVKNGYALKQYIDRKGYWRVTLNKRVDGKWKSQQVLVHRLLAIAFIPNPDNKPFINHKNGVRSDNTMDNLEWCTASYNVQDGFRRGRVAWNKHLKSTANMSLEDLARELSRLQEEAKALWGENNEEVDTTGFFGDTNRLENVQPWKKHLQQMVISEDPIKYLGSNV